jgi:ferredoxin
MIKITLNGESKEVIADDRDCLLMSMESAGFPVKIGCLSGMCEVCKLTVISGEENLLSIEEPMSELSEGEVLPCCVIAKGNVTFSSD